MKFPVETTSVAEYCRITIDLDACRPEYQHSQSFIVGGISFSPTHLLKRSALVRSIIVVGTIPFPGHDSDLLSQGIEAHFVFPLSPDPTAKDEYSKIREEIVASGLPMLSDEEVRVEIRDRKGGRGVTEP